MNREVNKGVSPFYPGQPVPVDLFVGREKQIDRIFTRGVGQVAAGKPIAIFTEGEWGIGKSSIAKYTQVLGQERAGLHGIYATLGGANNLEEAAVAILEAVVRSGTSHLRRTDRILDTFKNYVAEVSLGLVKLNMSALKKDAPNLTTPYSMLDLLSRTRNEIGGDEVSGLFLVLDDINGISRDPQFARFIKGLWEVNALSDKPLPLLLMLCGVEERRREMIATHPPVDRIFDVIRVGTLEPEDMKFFFGKAFAEAKMSVTPDAMDYLAHFSAGFPKIMHMVGDAAYWIDRDGIVDDADATRAVFAAAEEVGAKFVDQQVYRAVRSKDYQSILKKIARLDPSQMQFSRSQIASDLTDSEKSKLDNFLQKMKALNVLRPGDSRGEYVFNIRMVRLYIWMQSQARGDVDATAE